MYYEFPSPDGADECRGTGELSVETCTCSSIFFGFPDRAILTQATDRYGRSDNPVMQMMQVLCRTAGWASLERRNCAAGIIVLAPVGVTHGRSRKIQLFLQVRSTASLSAKSR